MPHLKSIPVKKEKASHLRKKTVPPSNGLCYTTHPMETILYFQPPSKTSAPGKFAGVQEIAETNGLHVQTIDGFPSAERLRELDVQKIYTGHCTGNRAFEILHEVLGDRAEQMFTGMLIEVG